MNGAGGTSQPCSLPSTLSSLETTAFASLADPSDVYLHTLRYIVR